MPIGRDQGDGQVRDIGPLSFSTATTDKGTVAPTWSRPPTTRGGATSPVIGGHRAAGTGTVRVSGEQRDGSGERDGLAGDDGRRTHPFGEPARRGVAPREAHTREAGRLGRDERARWPPGPGVPIRFT